MNPIQHIDELLALIQKADVAIMKVYDSRTTVVQTKADNSPITQADLASHHILLSGLTALFPTIPIISEEGDEAANLQTAATAHAFWLVDPIDGTRDFIRRTGDFTVCVALIEDTVPVFGIMSAPAHGVTYYGGPAIGSYKKQGNTPAQRIQVAPHKTNVVLTSRSHPDPITTAYIAKHYPHCTIKQVGSQLKFPYIAEGLADVYPRIGSFLHTWDVAAGDAILAGAGGKVTQPDGSAPNYRSPTLQVGDFIAVSR